jgi:hypothetical protein
MKKFVGSLVLALLVAGNVSAQQAPTFTETFDPETGDCFARCEVDATSQPAPAATQAVTKTVSAKRASGRRHGGGGGHSYASATARVDMDLFRKLETRVAELEDRVGEHDEELSELRNELAEMQDAMATSATVSVDGSGGTGESYDHGGILNALHNLDERIGQMEIAKRAPFGNSVGLTAGAVALLGGDNGMSFTAPFLGGRLNLGLTPRFYVYVEPALLVVPGVDHAFSAMVGGGIGYTLFGKGEAAGALELGLQNIAMGIGNDLNAAAIATVGTVGMNARLPENFRLGGTLLVGPAFMPDSDPSLALGGMVTLGYDFR